MDWLRLWHDMPNDPKWQTIARKSGEPISLVIAMYIHMLVDASRNVTRGHVTVTPEDLASALDVTDDRISAVLTAMEGRVIENGYLLGWDKRQPKREDSGNPETGAKSAAQRQKEKRERDRLAALSTSNQSTVTQCHDASRSVTTEEIRLEEIREDKGGERVTPTLAVDNSKPPPISDEFREVLNSRPEIPDPEATYLNFWAHYPAEKRTIAQWRKWVANEHIPPKRSGSAKAQSATADPDSRASIEAVGVASGIGKWDELRERWPEYKARVMNPKTPAATVPSRESWNKRNKIQGSAHAAQ